MDLDRFVNFYFYLLFINLFIFILFFWEKQLPKFGIWTLYSPYSYWICNSKILYKLWSRECIMMSIDRNNYIKWINYDFLKTQWEIFGVYSHQLKNIFELLPNMHVSAFTTVTGISTRMICYLSEPILRKIKIPNCSVNFTSVKFS